MHAVGNTPAEACHDGDGARVGTGTSPKSTEAIKWTHLSQWIQAGLPYAL
jgi:hypothetical protein